MKVMLAFVLAGFMFAFQACDEKKGDGEGDGQDSTEQADSSASASDSDSDQADADSDASEVFHYVCAMACEGSGSNEEGKCPGCDMDLVENPDWLALNGGEEAPEGDGHNHEGHSH